MKTRVAALILVAAAGASAAAGQQGGGPPAPAPEVTKMKWMVGSWNVTETHEKSPWSPGGTGKGTNVVTIGPGGHSYYFDYKSAGPMGNYVGKGLSTWDPNEKAFARSGPTTSRPDSHSPNAGRKGRTSSARGRPS